MRRICDATSRWPLMSCTLRSMKCLSLSSSARAVSGAVSSLEKSIDWAMTSECQARAWLGHRQHKIAGTKEQAQTMPAAWMFLIGLRQRPQTAP